MGIIITIFITLTCCICAMTKLESRDNEKIKIHILFPGQFALLLIALFISVFCFFSGRDMIFGYGCLWDVVKRGSLEALIAVMGIVGVGSVFLGWIYSERDKITLGKSQSEMVRYKYGPGYAGSVVVHFGSTALCVLMAKCGAKEAALWAFFTVVWGCVPQMLICIQIAMNSEQRKKLALELWRNEKSEGQTVLHKMVQHLRDADTLYHKGYCDMLCSKIVGWLCGCRKESDFVLECIESVSAVFREIEDKVPEMERVIFEEKILKSICRQLKEKRILKDEEEMALNLLCGGDFRFQYFKAGERPEHLEECMNRAMYFAQNDNEYYKFFGTQMRVLLCCLEWFLFLGQNYSLPRHIFTEDVPQSSLKTIFVQMTVSIFGENDNNRKLAEIAWKQVCPEVN